MGDSAPQAKVSVGVIMGSQSDWPTMAHAVQILEELGIAHEVQIVSGDFDTLTTNPQIDGVACIGTTRFRTLSELQPFESDPDRTIRPHASEKGAQLVRWGMREVMPVEKDAPMRWEYVAVYYRGFWRPEVASAGN